MTRATWWVAAGAALALFSGQAAFAQTTTTNTQQEKMTTCNADAKAKGLTGAERKEFMKSCLSSKGAEATGTGATTAEGSAAPTSNAQQEKMKSCSADAKTKGLKGAERKTFMKECLSSSSAH